MTAWIALYAAGAAVMFVYLVGGRRRDDFPIYPGDTLFDALCSVFWPFMIPVILYAVLRRRDR